MRGTEKVIFNVASVGQPRTLLCTGLATVIENTLLFGDILLRVPDMTNEVCRLNTGVSSCSTWTVNIWRIASLDLQESGKETRSDCLVCPTVQWHRRLWKGRKKTTQSCKLACLQHLTLNQTDVRFLYITDESRAGHYTKRGKLCQSLQNQTGTCMLTIYMYMVRILSVSKHIELPVLEAAERNEKSAKEEGETTAWKEAATKWTKTRTIDSSWYYEN